MRFDSTWEKSADRATKRDSRRRSRDLRFCPGIYKPDGTFHEVWLKCWLVETPYKTFDELWESGDVYFLFEGKHNRDENTETEGNM